MNLLEKQMFLLIMLHGYFKSLPMKIRASSECCVFKVEKKRKATKQKLLMCSTHLNSLFFLLLSLLTIFLFPIAVFARVIHLYVGARNGGEPFEQRLESPSFPPYLSAFLCAPRQPRTLFLMRRKTTE